MSCRRFISTDFLVVSLQHEVERVLAKVSESTGLELLSSKIDESGNPEDVKLDWTSFPRDVHPMGGELPLDRIEKKCHQVYAQTSSKQFLLVFLNDQKSPKVADQIIRVVSYNNAVKHIS